ncbi:PLC-like phosphodiesterase [Piromyces finnis]|uniref:PLC-like phosphodiesterase n=1 Tax=Piromyces finnis TaxID=1754191 RepID=A0A1Y1V2F5_9FUNG|nr:PLC-like phosphodiesterase [Piromyces finnis]|eukprot:ORX45625.1 PLC-like phosphodiesterase [Piromyces finnis]
MLSSLKNILYYTLYLELFILLTKAQKYCNGYESYCYKNYDELTYATTHNSFAVGKSYSANQELGISQQLYDGIRGLMLDVFYHDDGSVHLCHNSCTEPYLDAGRAVDILYEITEFIQQNPNEVITIFFENFNGNIPASTINELFTNSGLINYVFTPYYIGDWPTLGEMVDNHQNVVVFSDKLTDPAYPWYLSLSQYVSYNNYVSLSQEYWNCDVFGGSGSLFLLYHMKHVQILNSSGYLPDTTVIDQTNSFDSINEHIVNCQNKINFISVDYYNHGDIIEYVTRLNGETYTSVKKPIPTANANGSQLLKINSIVGIVITLLISYILL